MANRRLIWIALFLLLLVFAQSALAQSSPGNANASIQKFFAVSGWHQASEVQSAMATGTIQTGSTTSTFTLKIERSGRLRLETGNPASVMIAGPDGGTIKTDKGTKQLSVAQGAQIGSSVLIPIFTPLAEAALPTANVSLKRAATSSHAAISIGRSWNSKATNPTADAAVVAIMDREDRVREAAQEISVEFDPATSLLKAITLEHPTQQNPGKYVSGRVEYSDWRDVNGILLPYQLRETANGQELYKVRFETFSLNATVSDSDFVQQ